MPKHNFVDLTGRTLGRLLVLARSADNEHGLVMWACRCSCGQTKDVRGIDLRRGTTTSCGCSQREGAKALLTTHGRTGTPEHHLWTAARDRHIRRGIPFSITLADIHIPEFCPVLGLRLEPGVGKFHAASPSLDRIDPHGGYTHGNIVVMSFRANELKRDATLSELRAVLKYMQEGPPPEALVQEYGAPLKLDLRGDLTGHRFGKLLVAKQIKRWCYCNCDCGSPFGTYASQLRIQRSCGCVPRGTGGGTHKESSVHGRGSIRYELWRGAKQRAREKGLPFSIQVQGITIQERCPVLGIPLEPNFGGKTGAPGSPSLDRFDPPMGYVPGNTVVISQRANALKSDATVDEFTRLVQWVEKT